MKELTLNDPELPVIQLVHANGYNPGCYLQMCQSLSNYHITLPFLRPFWPGSDPFETSNPWQQFSDDLINHMEEQGRSNVIGIGHSLGGIVSWIAACKKPGLFSQLILIDPVVLPRKMTMMMGLLPYSIKRRWFPMVKIAAGRRDTWKNREEARDFFLTKKVYQKFDSKVLEDFIEHGLKVVDGGVTLAFPRLWESRIYSSSVVMHRFMHHSPCPITILRAEYSDVIFDKTWSYLQKNLDKGRFIELKGQGHLVPFEQPELCAQVIRQCLEGNDATRK